MGRIAKWAIEVLPFDIIYKPWLAIKSQVLADFVAEWTKVELPKEYGAYSNWIMHFDGSKMLAGLVACVVLTSPTGDTVQYCWGTLQKIKKFHTVSPRSIYEFI